jgi:hypothetical protein
MLARAPSLFHERIGADLQKRSRPARLHRSGLQKDGDLKRGYLGTRARASKRDG